MLHIRLIIMLNGVFVAILFLGVLLEQQPLIQHGSPLNTIG